MCDIGALPAFKLVGVGVDAPLPRSDVGSKFDSLVRKCSADDGIERTDENAREAGMSLMRVKPSGESGLGDSDVSAEIGVGNSAIGSHLSIERIIVDISYNCKFFDVCEERDKLASRDGMKVSIGRERRGLMDIGVLRGCESFRATSRLGDES